MNPLHALSARWAQLSGRERTLVAVAGALLGVFLVWSLLFRPALFALAAAPAEKEQAQATLDRLQALATQAATLRGGAAVAGAQAEPVRTMESGVDDSTRALLVAALGDSTRVDAQGRYVTVSFEGVSGEQVRQALRTLRSRLRAQLVEAELAPAQEGIRGRLRLEWTNG